MYKNHATKTSDQKEQPEKLESDHSSVIENDNTCSYTHEELFVISLFKIVNTLKEFNKPKHRKQFKLKSGEIIVNIFKEDKRLAFSTKYLQKYFQHISFEEIESLLKLSFKAGQIIGITDREVNYWSSTAL